MTTYTAIPNADVDQDSPVTQPLLTLLRDNPIAVAEGSTGAPVLSSSWHSHNMVNVGDGATGVFYDFAVNGAQASVVTPTFEDGYDYMVRLVGLGPHTSAFRVDGVGITVNNSNPITGTIEIFAPRLTSYPKMAMVNLRTTTPATGLVAYGQGGGSVYSWLQFAATTSALSSVTLSFATGNITAGQMFLYRRRNFMFG